MAAKIPDGGSLRTIYNRTHIKLFLRLAGSSKFGGEFLGILGENLVSVYLSNVVQ